MYRVAKYFDDHLTRWMTEPMSKEDAHKEADRLNERPRAYVSYEVRKTQEDE